MLYEVITLVDDPFVKNEKGEPQKLIQLKKEERISRAKDTIQALKYISGGAMQTNNMGDVTPKFIILATTNTGNHPFSHVIKSTGVRDEEAVLNVEGIEEVLKEYKDTFKGNVFIGIRSGFMDSEKENLQNIEKAFDFVKLGSVNEMIDLYCKQLETQMN